MRRIMDRRSRTYRPRERDYRERDYRERMSDRDKRRDYGQYEPYEEDYASRRRGRRDGNYGNYDRYDTHYDKEYDDYDYGYDRDYSDGEDDMRLTKRDITEWKSSMMNADGSRGEHFRGETIERVARDMGISFKDFDEKTLCLTTNMLYSDYCDVLRNYIPTDKEPYVYVALAKAFLDDEDAAVDGDEKLAAYYFAIVKGEMY